MSRGGARSDQRDRRQQQVEGPLDDHADRPIGAVDERQDLDPIEFLERAAGQRSGPGSTHRDPDDATLVLAQPGDRLDDREVLGVVRQIATSSTIGLWRIVLDIVDRSPRIGRVTACSARPRPVMRAGEVADGLEAELPMASHGVGERGRPGIRARRSSMYRRLQPRARGPNEGQRGSTSRTRIVRIAWAGNRISRNSRLTFGSFRMNRAVKTTTARIMIANRMSTASRLGDQRTRSR